MPNKKAPDYPKYSFEESLRLANAVLSLGGAAHSDEVAKALGRKTSGSFRILISSGVKHELVNYADWVVSLNPLYKRTTEGSTQEKTPDLQHFFLAPRIYKEVAERYGYDKTIAELIPIMRELGVEEEFVNRVARNFHLGAAYVGLNSQKSFTNNSDEKPKSIGEAPKPELGQLNFNKISQVPRNEEQQGTQTDSSTQENKHMTPVTEQSTSENQPITLVGQNPLSVQTLTIQMHLPNRRLAELVVPAEIYGKDLVIIRKYIEALQELVINQ
jgi:hypothetical protein